MRSFSIRLAEKNIKIISQYEYIKEYCNDYLISKSADESEIEADFEIKITQPDIDFERNKSVAEDKKEGLPIRNFSDSYLETLAVYRKIADKLIDCNTILFHGSVIAVDGVGYLFTAKSGTGKSTHTRLWREYFGNRAIMVNDDKPLIKIGEDGATVYGTPWDGKHRLSTNISVPLKAICILTRSIENRIEKINKSEAYAMLLQQINRPNNPEKMAKTLELLDRLIENVRLYKLECNMEIEVAEISYNGMKG